MADVDTTAEVERLHEVLYTWKKRVYYFCVPLDAWLVVVKPGFLEVGADFAAWQVECEVRGLADCPLLEGKPNMAMPLPTMAMSVARGMVVKLGRPSLLSAGWSAACKRMARLLDDCPAR